MRGFKFIEKYGILIVLILLCVFFSFMTNTFLTSRNLLNILRQISILGTVAVGMTFVLLSGGLDLSVGSLLALAGTTTSTLIVSGGINPWLAMLAGILATMTLGLTTGTIIQKFSLPPMIATLGMMTIVRGLAYIITGGLPVYGLPREYVWIGQGYVWVIPVPVIFMLTAFGVGAFVLDKTYLGRYFYAMGGNQEAARLAGINIGKMKILTYVISGFLCGVAGVILMFRINSGQPSAGMGTELDVITATVLGGVSLAGGEGKITGVLIGCLIIGVLSNGLIIMNVGEFYQMVVKGCVLILAVILDKMGQKYSEKQAKAIV